MNSLTEAERIVQRRKLSHTIGPTDIKSFQMSMSPEELTISPKRAVSVTRPSAMPPSVASVNSKLEPNRLVRVPDFIKRHLEVEAAEASAIHHEHHVA